MAKFPHPLDPITGRPMPGVIAHGFTEGFQDVVEAIRKTEFSMAPQVPQALRELPGFEVIKPGRSAMATGAFLQQMRGFGHQFRAELLDEASALRVHLLHEGKATGGVFDIPIEKAGYISTTPRALREPGLMDYAQGVKRSDFATRGGFVLEADQFRYQSWQERLYYSLGQTAGRQVGSAEESRDLARTMQKVISEHGYKSLVWSGSRLGALNEETGFVERMMRGAYTRTGSPFDIYQMGVMGVYQGPGIESAKLIDAYKSEFAFSSDPTQKFWDPHRALSQVKGFHEDVSRMLPFLKSAGIKPEAALAGNMGIWELGHLTPFGGMAEGLVDKTKYYGGGDPNRQIYQRLAVSRLVGAGARNVSPISTPAVEAMKELSYHQTGLSSRLATQARIALVLDPRFEQAVAGSAGGAILSEKLANSLTADVTMMANYESAKWGNLLEKGEGRAYSKTEVGSNLITSFGSKHTVAGIQKMRGAQMAIGWSTFLKGKNPEALREAVLRDVLEQAGQWRHVPKGTSAFDRQVMQKKNDLIGDFYRDVVANVLGKDKSKFVPATMAGGGEVVPQILVNPNAKFDLDELSRLTEAVNRHNTKIKALHEQGMFKDLRTIKEGFEVEDLRIGGERFRSVMLHAAVMRRMESPEVVRKAVGAWVAPANELVGYSFTVPEGYKYGRSYFKTKEGEVRRVLSDRYNPYGVKLGLRDLTNLRLWHTKEADQLAQVYERYVSRWQRQSKSEIGRAILPFSGVKDFPSTAPKFRDSIAANELASRFGKFSEAPRGNSFTLEQLKGSIFGAKSALRKQGVAIRLEQAISIGGHPDVPGQEFVTKEIYLPALESYRGVRDEMLSAGGKVGQVDVFIDKLKRRHEQLYLSIATGQKDPQVVEAKAREYYNELFTAFGGKTGMMAYFSTARMAHSGYLGLVPGGVGGVAGKMGTALEGSSFAHISESTARDMGVYDILENIRRNPKAAPLFGRVTAYPGIGPTMETVLQFKMVKDSELGSRALRLSNMVALTMFRDFDMDKAAVTFMLDKQAQSAMKAFYEKSVQPFYGRVETAIGQLAQDDPELASMLAKENSASKVAAEAMRDAKSGGRLAGNQMWIALANEKSASIRDRAMGGLMEKFGTKLLTPAANWYAQSFRELIEREEVVGALQTKGYSTTRTALFEAANVMGLIEQQSAITKGKAIIPAAQGLLPLMHAAYDLSTTGGKEQFEKAVGEASGHLAGLLEASSGAGAREIYAGAQGRGGWIYLREAEQRKQVARDLLMVGQLRRDILEKGQGKYPGFGTWLSKTISQGEHQAASFTAFRDLAQLAEAEAAMAGDSNAGMEIWKQRVSSIERMLGWKKNMGFVVGTEEAALQEWKERVTKEGFGKGLQSALNQDIKDAGAAAGRTVLDRVADWWTRVETPGWQKAGVITGAALIMGAVAKNLFFSRYGPDQPVPISQPLAFTPPPPVMPSSPIAVPHGPFEAPEQPYNLWKKPGGVWARVANQIGYESGAYDMEPREGMVPVKPNFGSRVHMPGVGLDLGPGIADSDSRPLIMAGPPVGGGSPLPPAIPQTGRSEPDMPYTVQQSEPVARVVTPDYMRGGTSIRATAPERGGDTGADLEGIIRSAGSRADVVMNRWEPREGIIDRHMATMDEESSSFV